MKPIAILTSSVFALSLCSFSLQAAVLSYQFDVSIDSGSLNGTVYSGDFVFDDLSLTGVGEEQVALNSFHFGFLGNSLTLADDTVASALFFNGALLGIGINVNRPEFSVSFVPGFFDLSEAYFSYDQNNNSGFGSLTVSTVPVPAALPLLLTGLSALGFLGRRKKQLFS